MTLYSFGKLLLCIGICQAAGLLGAVSTRGAISGWYQTLVRPVLSPPNWLFGPVWTLLYTLMGVALYLVWQRGLATPGVRIALIVFGIQLALNAAWSIVFFGMQNIGGALIIIIAMIIAISATILLFWRVSPPAALILLPYLAWVSFATYLNYSFYTLN